MAIAGENKFFTCIRCADNDEWLAERNKGVGGSDVAAIVGVSPWNTVAKLWMEKTGRIKPEDISDKPYVKFGNDMEPLIGRWYAERYPNRKVRRVNAICQSMTRPWAQASLDFEVFDPDLGWGVLEIKTARDSKDWDDGVPTYYLTQVTHYLSVTNRPFADLVVFFRDTCEYACFRIERDQEDIDFVDDAVDTFWNSYVMKDVMPQIVGTQDESSSLARIYGQPNGDFVSVDDTKVIDLINAYQDASEREKRANADKTAANAKLAALIGDHKGLMSDTHRVTWVRSTRTKFDQKKFRQEHPDLYDQYASSYSQNGGLRIKEL